MLLSECMIEDSNILLLNYVIFGNCDFTVASTMHIWEGRVSWGKNACLSGQ